MENRPRTESGRIIISVGQDAGDLRGESDRALQAAVDYVAGIGGGCVQLMDGVYAMHNSLLMRPGVVLSGSGPNTVLRKGAGKRSLLVRDADWYEASVELGDVSGLRPGGGLMLRAYGEDGKKLRSVVRRTITAIDGGIVTLSERLTANMWLEDQANAAPLFPIITAKEETHDIQISDLTLDGSLTENEEINGNYSGGVFIQRCDRWTFSNVTSRNYNGDGFSFQVCDDIHFESCRSEDNANLGFHPGSGSQRPIFKDCVSVRNSQGIFFCWGVSDGLVEGCVCSENRDFGISIGHRDTDNRITNTEIDRNHKVGVLFREMEMFRGGHRNLIEGCRIRDNGFALDGVGIDVRGETVDVQIIGNEISDTGDGKQKIGVRIGERADNIQVSKNTCVGLMTDVEEIKS